MSKEHPQKRKLSERDEPVPTQPSPSSFASPELIGRLLANGDVWQCIFALLSPLDRVRTEMTNKRLGSLFRGFWQRETSFDAASVRSANDNNPDAGRQRAKGVVAICGRIGVGLRSLKLNDDDDLAMDWSEDLRSIADECPNIESIHFHIERRHVDQRFMFGPFGGMRTPLKLPAPSNLRFSSFLSLKSLSFSIKGPRGSCLSRYVHASAAVFASIPPSIERIVDLVGMDGSERPFATGADVEAFFANRPALREVHLENLCTRDPREWYDGGYADVFRVIAERCPSLKQIDLEHLGNCLNVNVLGLSALESMREIRLRGLFSKARLSDAELIKICARNPDIEILSLGSTVVREKLGAPSFDAVATLTKLRELKIASRDADLSAAQATRFVRELGRNSGASLRMLKLLCIQLPTAAIDALAAGCAKLLVVAFGVRVGEATPASILNLVDCIVADPSWPETRRRGGQFQITLRVVRAVDADPNDNADDAAFAPFMALTQIGPAGWNMAGPDLHITVTPRIQFTTFP